MGNEWEMYFTIGWLALWFLFPVGIFLSVGRLDRNTDELEQLAKKPVKKPSRARSGFHIPRLEPRH